MSMLERLPVIINRDGGTAATLGDGLEAAIRAAFDAVGVAIDLQLVAGRDVAATVTALASARTIAVGGGDGTLGSVARILAAAGATLAILPVGTRNHLARELGIPLDLVGAAQTIADGHSRRIDLAEVNGEGFINNASVGFYPLLVRWRDAERHRRGIPKWVATIPATWATLKRLRHHRMYLRSSAGDRRVRTPLLFVGNNRYALEPGRIGRRVSLDDGLLSVVSVTECSRLGLLWIALRLLVGRADPHRDFSAYGDVAELTIESASETIDVALDGEVHKLATPLHFRIEPAALAVCVPVDQPDRTAPLEKSPAVD